MYFITPKRMLEVCFSAHPNIQYRTSFWFNRKCLLLNKNRSAEDRTAAAGNNAATATRRRLSLSANSLNGPLV